MKKLIILFFILSVNNGFTQSRKKILETTNEIIQDNDFEADLQIFQIKFLSF